VSSGSRQRKRRPSSIAHSSSAPEERLQFAKSLRRLRSERGYFQRDFAQALGIDVNRYSRYERAEVEPKEPRSSIAESVNKSARHQSR
jgi:ribosome-binding protein aMBF1 (putative translation factor)